MMFDTGAHMPLWKGLGVRAEGREAVEVVKDGAWYTRVASFKEAMAVLPELHIQFTAVAWVLL